MEVYTNGYNCEHFRPNEMRELARRVARELPQLMRYVGADTVVVTGKSGVSVAFAALMFADFPLVVVRKPNESSHGLRIEGPSGHTMQQYIILDDFIATGDTVRRVANQIADRDETARCVGVLSYKTGGPADVSVYGEHVWEMYVVKNYSL